MVNRSLSIEYVGLGTSFGLVVQQITDWLVEADSLIAIDAPLGWPIAMGSMLTEHKAGMSLDIDSHELFRRETDRFVKRRTGKQTLAVGADRIGRTAHSALSLLRAIRDSSKQTLPLAWHPNLKQSAVIEVYPATTLISRKIQSTAYKDTNSHRPARARMVTALAEHIELHRWHSAMVENADVLDSVVCCLAGYDFLLGHCVEPDNHDLAKKEGWIWVRRSFNSS